MATGDKLASLDDLKVVKDYTDAQLGTVDTALAAKAPLASPALTGNPTAPTQTAGNNSTRIATTAFVKAAVDTVGSEVSSLASAIGTVPTGETVEGQISGLQENKAAMIMVEDETAEAVKTITDGADGLPMGLEVAIEPAQDLHGYDYPWVGGAGKNKLKTLTEASTSSGITATPNADGSITLTGTNNTTATYIDLDTAFDSASLAGYVFNVEQTGSNWGSSYVVVRVCASTSSRGALQDLSNGDTITNNGSGVCITLRIAANHAFPSGGTTYKLMVRASTDTGTFEPYTNICPITDVTKANITRTGKNLFDISSYPLTNGKYIHGLNGGEKETSGTNYDRTHDFIPFEGFDGKKITLNKRPSGTSPGIAFYSAASESAYVGGMRNAGATGGTPMTVEVPSGTKYMRFCVNAGTTDVQIELGETATEYEPFTGQNTYNITFPVTAGTVYGGTLTVNQDGTGTLVVDRVNVVLDGTESFTLYSAGTSNARITMAKKADDSRFPNMLKPIDDAGRISSHYKMANITSSTVGYGLLMYYSGSNTYPSFTFRDPLIVASEDSTAFATWVAGQYTAGTPVTLSYKLAESTSYTLTVPQVRTLLGQNYLWSDTGDVLSVRYPADTKMYIDGKIAELTALVLENISNS